MLFLSETTIAKILNPENKIIELSGLPEAGSSSASIHILKALDGIGFYIGNQQNAVQIPLYKNYLEADCDRIIFSIIDEQEPSEKALLNCIKTFGSDVDTVVIDNFAYYILHKSKPYIKKLMSQLYSIALELDIRIIIVNQLRYDVFSAFNTKHKEQQKNTTAPLKTLYSDYLGQHIDLKIKCSRPPDNNQDIYVEVDDILPDKSSSSMLTKYWQNFIEK